MTFEQLKYFSEVVKQKSLNKAAKVSNLSYQAMLKSMNKLEAELNMSLFYRTTMGITLTPEGEIFYRDVQKILQMQANWITIASKNENYRPKVTIYATMFFVDNFIKEIIYPLKNQLYNINCSACFDDVIEKLIQLSKERRKETIFLTCNSVGDKSIEQLAKENGFICEGILRDYYCVYFNRAFLQDKYGSDVVSVESADLENITFIEDKYYNYQDHDRFFQQMGVLPNKDMSIKSDYREEKFLLLSEIKGYTIYNKSLLEKIEQTYPYIKGVDIKDVKPKIDYYIIYDKDAIEDVGYIVDYIKRFFENITKHNL